MRLFVLKVRALELGKDPGIDVLLKAIYILLLLHDLLLESVDRPDMILVIDSVERAHQHRLIPLLRLK